MLDAITHPTGRDGAGLGSSMGTQGKVHHSPSQMVATGGGHVGTGCAVDITDEERHQMRHLLFFQLQPQPAPHSTWHFGVMAGVSQATCTCKQMSKEHKINTSSFPYTASICPPLVPASPVPELVSHQESPRAQPYFTASQHHTSAPCHRGSTKACPSCS